MYFRVIQPGKMIFASVSEKFLNIFSREFYVFFFFFFFIWLFFVSCLFLCPCVVPAMCSLCFVPDPLSNVPLAKNKLVSFAAPRFLFYAIGLWVESCDDHSGNGDRPPTLALSVCGCLLFILAACGTIIVQSIC